VQKLFVVKEPIIGDGAILEYVVHLLLTVAQAKLLQCYLKVPRSEHSAVISIMLLEECNRCAQKVLVIASQALLVQLHGLLMPRILSIRGMLFSTPWNLLAAELELCRSESAVANCR
jgi:hypothetical protein